MIAIESALSYPHEHDDNPVVHLLTPGAWRSAGMALHAVGAGGVVTLCADDPECANDACPHGFVFDLTPAAARALAAELLDRASAVDGPVAAVDA